MIVSVQVSTVTGTTGDSYRWSQVLVREGAVEGLAGSFGVNGAVSESLLGVVQRLARHATAAAAVLHWEQPVGLR